MIEFALEKFPLRQNLPDGLQITLRPMEPSDESGFEEFIVAIPEVERLFIKERITDQSIFHRWCSELDFQTNLPLLAFADGRLVADGTLHQREGGWKRHIGLVSVLTHPEYRSRGIVDVLVEELVEIGRHCGLSKLEAEFNGEREAGIKAFATAGFSELVRLENYVQDMHGMRHDYVLMGMDLQPPEELTGAGD